MCEDGFSTLFRLKQGLKFYTESRLFARLCITGFEAENGWFVNGLCVLFLYVIAEKMNNMLNVL